MKKKFQPPRTVEEMRERLEAVQGIWKDRAKGKTSSLAIKPATELISPKCHSSPHGKFLNICHRRFQKFCSFDLFASGVP